MKDLLPDCCANFSVCNGYGTLPSVFVVRSILFFTIVFAPLQELWERAREFPLFGTLHDPSSYHFACISHQTGPQELMDETKCLQDITPFMWILKVVERKGNESEKRLNLQIGQLIGKGKIGAKYILHSGNISSCLDCLCVITWLVHKFL